MKNILLIAWIICSMDALAQQSSINGVVSIFNSETYTGKRQYVPGAQVEDDFNKVQPTVTNTGGQFRLVFTKVEEKASVDFKVRKPGLQVVNIDALTAVAGQNEMIKVSMAHPDSIAEYRRKIYNVGKTEAEKQLEKLAQSKIKALAELKRNNEQNRSKISELQQQLVQLDEQRKKIEEQALELAKKYSPVNLDDASPLFQQAFILFQQGNLDAALQLLNQANFQEKVDSILLEENKIEQGKQDLEKRDSFKNQRKDEYAQGIILQADIYKTRYKIDSASKYYKLLIKLDSRNPDYIFNYAYFLKWQNQFDSAINNYLRVLAILRGSKSGSQVYERNLALTQNHLGNLYSNKHDFVNSEEAYLEALEICKHLAKSNPQVYEPDLSMTQTNLGNLYYEEHDYVKAEIAYQEALEICRRLAGINPQVYERELAITQNNLGGLYHDKHDYVRSEAAYQEALEICKRLAKNNSQVYERDLAMTQNNLGILYHDKHDFTSSEKAYQEALEIYKRLADSISRVYEPNVAITQNNLGGLYLDKHDYTRAETAYQEALEIYKRLSTNNLQVYERNLAMTQNNLGALYHDKHDYVRSEAAYREALEICKRLTKNNSQVYERDLAMTQNNLGILYRDKHDYVRSEEAYQETLEIYKRLAKSNPQIYEPFVATIQHNLGHLYNDQDDYAKAGMAYRKALEIYKRLADIDPQVYELSVATMQNDLGELYILVQKYKLSETLLIEALRTRLKWMNRYPQIYTGEARHTTMKLLLLYDTVLDSLKHTSIIDNNPNNFETVEGILISQSKIDTAIAQSLSSYYGHCSWHLLFASKFSEAEQVARKGLEVKPENIWIKTTLAHSLLLQNQYTEAIIIYQELKGIKDDLGKPYTSNCLEDLDEMEKQGIIHKDIAKARTNLKEWSKTSTSSTRQ